MWASFGSPDGRFDTLQAARVLGLRTDHVLEVLSGDRPLVTTAAHLRMLRVRARFHGGGRYRWPALDPATRHRGWSAVLAATRVLERGAGHPVDGGVHLVRFRHARVHAACITTSPEGLARLRALGEVIASRPVPDRESGIVVQGALLRLVDDGRCLPPRELVRWGRAASWQSTVPTEELVTLLREHQVGDPVDGRAA
jgi:hypothetical protein